eukprot:945375-Prorocentrum_minimum.AAC.1
MFDPDTGKLLYYGGAADSGVVGRSTVDTQLYSLDLAVLPARGTVAERTSAAGSAWSVVEVSAPTAATSQYADMALMANTIYSVLPLPLPPLPPPVRSRCLRRVHRLRMVVRAASRIDPAYPLPPPRPSSPPAKGGVRTERDGGTNRWHHPADPGADTIQLHRVPAPHAAADAVRFWDPDPAGRHVLRRVHHLVPSGPIRHGRHHPRGVVGPHCSEVRDSGLLYVLVRRGKLRVVDGGIAHHRGVLDDRRSRVLLPIIRLSLVVEVPGACANLATCDGVLGGCFRSFVKSFSFICERLALLYALKVKRGWLVAGALGGGGVVMTAVATGCPTFRLVTFTNLSAEAGGAFYLNGALCSTVMDRC